MKILILGHAGHGKDEVAKILVKKFGLQFYSATEYINEYIVYPALRDNYKSKEDCLLDKNNNRSLWYDLVYDSKIDIVKEVLKKSDIYVGLRDISMLLKCIHNKTFDLILCVYNPLLKTEDTSSMTIPLFMYSDIVILNNKDLQSLEDKVSYLNITNS